MTTSEETRLRGLIEADTIKYWQTLGITIASIEVGRLRLALPMRPELGTYRRDHVMHGGAIASLIDAAGSVARTLQTPDEPAWTAVATTDLNVSYLEAATTNLTADARVLRAGRTVAFVEVEVRNTEDTLVAIGRATIAIRRA
jgi:uncharacterized protein (TIGR00369 family)